MIGLINILLIFFVFIVIPFILGNLWNQLSHNEETADISVCIPFGFAIMLATYQVLSVPMIVFHFSFSALTLAWLVSIIILLFTSIYFNRNTIIEKIKQFRLFDGYGKTEKLIFAVALIIIIFQTCLLTFCMHMDTDDSRFVAEAMECYEQNTMLRVHPINGSFIGNPVGEMLKELTSPFPIFLATISKIIKVHPAVTAHVVLPLFLIPLCYVVVFSIGKYFLNDNKRNISTFMLIFSAIMLFSFESIYALGYTLLTIIWQGRSIVATIMLPFLWLILMKLLTESTGWKAYIVLLIVILANCCLSGMGIMMSVGLVLTYAVTVLLLNNDFKKFIYMSLTTVPGIVYFLYYCILSGGK